MKISNIKIEEVCKYFVSEAEKQPSTVESFIRFTDEETSGLPEDLRRELSEGARLTKHGSGCTVAYTIRFHFGGTGYIKVAGTKITQAKQCLINELKAMVKGTNAGDHVCIDRTADGQECEQLFAELAKRLTSYGE